MLAPMSGQSSESGNFQTSNLVLPGGSASAKGQAGGQCAINGEVFSLRSASPSDSRYWIVRSPSLSGWNTVARQIDIESQWKVFTRGVARMNDHGCFPPGLTAFEIRAAIAQRIPLPVGEVPLFFYSEQEMGFIDLAPGMEVRLQQFLPARVSSGAQSNGPPKDGIPNYRAAIYEVIARRGKGDRLRLTKKEQRGPSGSGLEDKAFFSLAEQFSQTPVLRLFLEGVYGKGKVSNGILIGASDETQLDALTDLIYQSDPAKCVHDQGTVCVEFPPGAPSLYFTVQVNGHRTSNLMGSSFASLLRALPRPEQARALESAKVLRRLNPDQYAEIHFPRTEDGASELLLLPGDRIEWEH